MMSPSFLFKIHSLPFCYSNSAATKSRLQFIAYELLPLLFLDYDFDQLTMSKRLWRLQFLGERVVKTGWHRSEIFFLKEQFYLLEISLLFNALVLLMIRHDLSKIQNSKTSSFSEGKEFLRHSDRRLTSMDFPQFCPLFYGNNVVIVFPHLWRDKSLYLVTAAAAAWLLYYCGLKAHCHPSMKIMDDSRPLCIHNDGVHMVDNNSKKNREKDNAHSWLLILLC